MTLLEPYSIRLDHFHTFPTQDRVLEQDRSRVAQCVATITNPGTLRELGPHF